MRNAGGKPDSCSSPAFAKRNSEKQVLRRSLRVASGHGNAHDLNIRTILMAEQILRTASG